LETFEHDHERVRRPQQDAAEAPERRPLEQLASGVGNRAFGALAREGAGILPDGRAHPDVEAAIARSRGGGQALDPATREQVAPAVGDHLADVRIHTGPEADALTRSVSARAYTTGSDVYFAEGEYSPKSSEGESLLAHELTHVAQQRGAATSGPLVVSQPGDALEAEADSVSSELRG